MIGDVEWYMLRFGLSLRHMIQHVNGDCLSGLLI